MPNIKLVPDSFDGTNSRPSLDAEIALAKRDTPFNIVEFPKILETFDNYEQYLASEEYKRLLDDFYDIYNARNFGSGMSPKFNLITLDVNRVLLDLMNKEDGNEKQLEELCESLIRDYFNLDKNVLNFNIKLIKQSISVKDTPSNLKLKKEKETNIEEYNNLIPEIAKRRIINALIQGNAVTGTYLYRMAEDSLIDILKDDNIVDKYNKFFSVALLRYWQSPNYVLSSIMGVNNNGTAIGKTKLDSSTTPPTINSEAIVFPLLIHETIKGVMEFLSKERNPEDLKRTEKAIDYADQILHEVWDIRLGPVMWRKLENLFPNAVNTDEDKKKLKYFIYSNIVNLPAKEFLVLINEILEQTDDARILIAAMYYDLCIMVDGEDVSEEEYNFRERMDDMLKKKR